MISKKDSWLSPQDSPRVEIVEQPKQKELRFRYECEGRSAGSIPGENSTPDKKTYPTIKIHNYKGSARVVVSCVTREKSNAKPRPHPHGLVGKDCFNGICRKNIAKAEKAIKFENLGIQCIKKKEIVSALTERMEKDIDPYHNFKLTTHDPKKLVAEYDLNVVCLCFQVYIANEESPDQPNFPLEPVITQPIFDKKGATLSIARVDRKSCSVKGDVELFILCDKIQRDDIKVKFFDGEWTDYAEFGPTDIHRQVAIVCKIPPYKDPNIQQPKNVYFKLVRPSDGEESQAIEFSYEPYDRDPERVGSKRKRNNTPLYDNYLNQSPATKSENQNFPTCRFSKPGSTSRNKHDKTADVKEKLKKFVAKRSNPSASQGKAPEEDGFPKTTLSGEKFYSSPSGNTGKVIEQDPMATIDTRGLLTLLSTNKGIDDGDVQINLGAPVMNNIDESEVQLNIDALNPYLMPVSASPITPVSVSEPSPMEQETSVLDILGPMSDGYQNVIVQNVPGSLTPNLGSDTTSPVVDMVDATSQQQRDMIDATIQQMLNGTGVTIENTPGTMTTNMESESTNQGNEVVDTTIQQLLKGGDVVIENFPSLSNYLIDDIASLQQQILQQEQERHQMEQQQVEQRRLEQQNAEDGNRVGAEYIIEEVHDSLNLPVFNSIDIGNEEMRNHHEGTM